LATLLDSFELPTLDDHKLLRLDDVTKFGDGSGCRCYVTIRSGALGCDRYTFLFDDQSLKEAIAALTRMIERLEGRAKLGSMFENPYIAFTVDHLGHVEVSGELPSQDQHNQLLRFSFETDQTVLAPLRKMLQDLSDA